MQAGAAGAAQRLYAEMVGMLANKSGYRETNVNAWSSLDIFSAMRSLNRKADLAFIGELEQQAMTFAGAFRDAESVAEQGKRDYRRQDDFTAGETQIISERFVDQRDALVRQYDRTVAIFNRYRVPFILDRLLKIQPGDSNDWSQTMHLDDRYIIELHDSFGRIRGAIEHGPSFMTELSSLPQAGWKWLDERGLAKWIVAAFFTLVSLWILRVFGYDLNGLIQLVKAIRGDK